MTPSAMPATAVLDREFFEIRAKILEIAASFDRLDRGAGSVSNDPRSHKIQEALDVLQQQRGERAEEIQLIFSRPYDDEWQENFGLDSTTSD